MYLLKKIVVPIVGAVVLFSCKASGPLTPDEAFQMARAAAVSSNYTVLAELMSRESIQKINTTASLFHTMPAARVAAIARHYGISTESLVALSQEEYIRIMLMDDQSILQRSLHAEITGIDRDGSRAIVRLHNGLSLDFVQEGPYWKLNIENL